MLLSRSPGRLWISHQAALEYHRNLDAVRREPVAACEELKVTLEAAQKKRRAEDHRMVEKFARAAKTKLESEVEKACVEKIADLFDGHVGRPPQSAW